MGLESSPQPIALSVDPTALDCVFAPGKLCPARVRIDSLFTELVNATLVNPPLKPHLDGFKRDARLRKHQVQATLRGCEGPDDGRCEPWVEMTGSPPHRTAVSGIRRAINFFRG